VYLLSFQSRLLARMWLADGFLCVAALAVSAVSFSTFVLVLLSIFFSGEKPQNITTIELSDWLSTVYQHYNDHEKLTENNGKPPRAPAAAITCPYRSIPQGYPAITLGY